VQTLSGPLLGAAVYHGLEIWFSTLTRYWPLFLGVIIVVLVLAFPYGLAGFASRWLDRGETSR